MQPMPHTLGSLLLRRRIDAGLTQQELARRSAVSVRALRDIEQDRVRHPRPQSVRRLAAALELSRVDEDELLEAAGKRHDSRPRVGVLGPLTVHCGPVLVDVFAPTQGDLLGLLALQAGQAVSCAEIVDMLWGEDPPKSCTTLVHVYIRQIRNLLEPQRQTREPAQIVVRNRSAYQLVLDAIQLDLAFFNELTAKARQRQSAGDPQSAYECFEQALRCWRGPILANASPRLRHHPATIAVSQRRLAAALSFADIAVDLGRHEMAKDLLWGLTLDEPLHEGLHARLIMSLAGCGDQATALRLLADFRTRLADELGVEPGAEIQDAHLRVLRQQLPGAQPSAGSATPATVHLSATPKSKAWGGTPPAQLPLDVHGFTGRLQYLKRLDELLEQQQDPAMTALTVVVIAGIPGVGKTALSVHWAHSAAGRFPDGQLYVNLRGFDPTSAAISPAEALRGFLDALGVPLQEIPVDLPAQAALFRSLLVSKRVLVVLDNARDAEQVRPLLPGAPGCMVLVTGRGRLNGLVAAEGAQPLDLDLLTEAESRELLSRRIGHDRVAAKPQAVDELITRCAGLPLALTVVAAHGATRPEFPLDSLVKELQACGGGLDPFTGDDAATDVRAVFSWSYHALGDAPARLFRLLGLHPVADIAAPAAASLIGVPQEQVRPLLGELDRAHLATQYTPGRYTVHDLLRVYANELAHTVDSEPARRAALHRLLDHYLHTAANATLLMDPHRDRITMPPAQPGVTPEEFAQPGQAIAWFDAEHPVLLAAIAQAAATGFDVHVWQLAWTLVDYFDRRGRWHDWVATQTAALEAVRRLDDRPQQAHAHRSLARAYAPLRRYDDAHSHLRQALDLCGGLEDHAGQAKTHGTIGWLCGLQGRRSEALYHAQQALALFERAGHQVGQAKALNQVGWYHIELGNHEQALIICRQALTLQHQTGDRDGEANTWDSLGYAHDHLGDYEQATVCYQRAVDLFRDLGYRYAEADSLGRLGDSNRAAGDANAAHGAWRRALTILDELGHARADQIRAKLRELNRLAGAQAQAPR